MGLIENDITRCLGDVGPAKIGCTKQEGIGDAGHIGSSNTEGGVGDDESLSSESEHECAESIGTDHNKYFRQCYRQAGLLIPWDIPGAQPDIVSLQNANPSFFTSPVLDVGAGLGNTSIWLASKLGLDVVAVDVSADAVAEGQRRFTAASEKNCKKGEERISAKFLACDICSPLPQALTDMDSFGTVLDSAAFHCIGGPVQQRRYVEAVTSLVRPGGHLVMLAHSDNAPDYGGQSNTMRRVSKEELHGFFNTASGWTVIEIRECRYCCMSPSMPGKPPRGIACAAYLMVARRLGD